MATTEQEEKKGNNKNGVGGFGDNPQHRNNGAWKKTETFRYWFNLFKEMTIEEFDKWQKDNLEDKRTVAADLAVKRIVKSQTDLREFQEVANRSEGMPKQTFETNDVGQNYEKYLLLCEEYGLDPKTGLRLDNSSSKVE